MTSFKVQRLLTNHTASAGESIHGPFSVVPPVDGFYTFFLRVHGTIGAGAPTMFVMGAPDAAFLALEPKGCTLARIRLNLDLDSVLKTGAVECVAVPLIVIRLTSMAGTEVLNLWMQE